MDPGTLGEKIGVDIGVGGTFAIAGSMALGGTKGGAVACSWMGLGAGACALGGAVLGGGIGFIGGKKARQWWYEDEIASFAAQSRIAGIALSDLDAKTVRRNEMMNNIDYMVGTPMMAAFGPLNSKLLKSFGRMLRWGTRGATWRYFGSGFLREIRHVGSVSRSIYWFGAGFFGAGKERILPLLKTVKP